MSVLGEIAFLISAFHTSVVVRTLVEADPSLGYALQVAGTLCNKQ